MGSFDDYGSAFYLLAGVHDRWFNQAVVLSVVAALGGSFSA